MAGCEKQGSVSVAVHVGIVMVLQFFNFRIAQEQEFAQESCGDFLQFYSSIYKNGIHNSYSVMKMIVPDYSSYFPAYAC